MGEIRRPLEDGYKYEFSRNGAFGIFDTENTIPIEFIMTSFTVNELPHLSLARELYSDLNFDYLIQRDIDEERALSEISQYIYTDGTKKQKEIIFLPPLLVAVVETDNQDNIIETYPDSEFKYKDDKYGGSYIREWPGVFKVENYPAKKGFELNVLDSELKIKTIQVTSNQAEISLNLSPKQMKGAKLVVIDGQHRLYALNYLRREHYESVKNIVLPVCIVYSPKSISSLSSEGTDIPNIQSVMRSLFVDVNSTVERVSGHFLTLLKDDSLGSVICRDFCNEVLNTPSLSKEGLGLIEWNTKNHKESLNISREHTTTSIGVINSAIEEMFNNKSGIQLMNEILRIDDNISDFDFGFDEYENKKSKPEKFPLESISLKHKSKLTELVNENITKYLVSIFFESKCYKALYDTFKESLDDVIETAISERKSISDSASLVKNNIIFNDPIDSSQKKARELRLEFYNVLVEKRKGKVSEIIRRSIFQKAIIETWFKILEIVIASGATVKEATEVLIVALDYSLIDCGRNYDFRQPYVQNTIYNANKLKVTKETRKQLSRLIMCSLNSPYVYNKINDIVSHSCAERLSALASKDFSSYVSRMTLDKKKYFEKSYKVNFSVSSFDREKLLQLESERDEKLLLASNASERREANEPFDKAVIEAISTELDLALESLRGNFGIEASVLVFTSDDGEDE